MLGTACLSISCMVDKVMSYTMSTALAMSPGTSMLHRLCASLLWSSFPAPYLFHPGACDASNSTLPHWKAAAKLKMAESNSTLATGSHPPTPTALGVPAQYYSQHHHWTQQAAKHAPPQPWPACPPSFQAGDKEYKIVYTDYFAKQLNGSYRGMWTWLYNKETCINLSWSPIPRMTLSV